MPEIRPGTASFRDTRSGVAFQHGPRRYTALYLRTGRRSRCRRKGTAVQEPGNKDVDVGEVEDIVFIEVGDRVGREEARGEYSDVGKVEADQKARRHRTVRIG